MRRLPLFGVTRVPVAIGIGIMILAGIGWSANLFGIASRAARLPVTLACDRQCQDGAFTIENNSDVMLSDIRLELNGRYTTRLDGMRPHDRIRVLAADFAADDGTRFDPSKTRVMTLEVGAVVNKTSRGSSFWDFR